MLFTLDDIWYVTLSKLLILGLAFWILLRISIQSLWNCRERRRSFSAAVKAQDYRKIFGSFIAIFINVLFIWIMLQGLALLLFGCFGVSPKELLSWKFREISFVGVLFLIWQYNRFKRSST